MAIRKGSVMVPSQTSKKVETERTAKDPHILLLDAIETKVDV